ncbi:MAG: alpha/beta hydrolase, partial [Gammaproteobacteria bacterium]|nr:alpha/beta hydrolase [Gammaproteobacteria bacterium]
MAMYVTELAADIPEAISGAARGDGDTMQVLVESYVNWILDTELNDVNYYSVECNDRELVTAKEYQAKIEPYPDLLKYTRYGWRYDPCRVWGRKQNLNLSKDPVRSSIPTLILSGRNDPITPWQWGAEVSSAMPNSYHFVYEKTAHSVLDSNDCALQTSRGFIHEPGQMPDNDC